MLPSVYIILNFVNMIFFSQTVYLIDERINNSIALGLIKPLIETICLNNGLPLRYAINLTSSKANKLVNKPVYTCEIR